MEFTITRKGVPITCFCDHADWPFIRQFCWNLNSADGYLIRIVGAAKDRKRELFVLHRELLGLHGKDSLETVVDHINGNKQDNRRSNLRVVSRCQNAFNSRVRPMYRGRNRSSEYRGVSRLKSGRWQAYIKINTQRKNLGVFDTENEAAFAWNVAAQKAMNGFFHPNQIGVDNAKS